MYVGAASFCLPTCSSTCALSARPPAPRFRKTGGIVSFEPHHLSTRPLEFVPSVRMRPLLPLSLILTRKYPPPLPPLPNTFVHLLPRDPISHQPKSHPQLHLHVPIPRLVIKKQHIRKGDLIRRLPAPFLYPLEMRGLGPWEDLHVGEVLERLETLGWLAFGLLILLRLVRLDVVVLDIGSEGWRHDEVLQHVPGQVRGVRSTGHAHGEAPLSGGVQDAGHVRVQGKGLAPLVLDAGVGVFGFDGRGHVGVDPEGPEGVVEVEDDNTREGQRVKERGWTGVGEGATGRGGGLEACGGERRYER
jgi:hypothetical protein